MKRNYFFAVILYLGFFLNTIVAQTIWTGPVTTFTKVDGADWTQEANQDRITNNVWITRANSQGIFNIKNETSYIFNVSPTDTRWAFGTTSNIGSLTFDSWEKTITAASPISPTTNMVGKNMVLHLITDNIYIDIKFLSWSSGGSGGLGGFSYERTTDQSLSIDDYKLYTSIRIHPNPCSSVINILNLNQQEGYKIFNILGVKIAEGNLKNTNQIDIQNFKSGIYILYLNNGKVLRFIKK